jgi:hypothetical protein
MLVALSILVFALALAAPAFGFGDTEVNTDIKNSKLQGAVGDGNIGLQSNGSIHHNNIGSTTVTGDVINKGGKGGEGGAGGEGGSINIGTGFLSGGNFSPVAKGGSATIEKGAISNKNTNMNFNTNKTDVDVSNKNTNFNTNLNTNKQGQEQGQGQVQGQGQAQKNENNQNIVFEAEEYKRALPTGHGNAYRTDGPEFHSEPNRTGNIQDSEDILQVRKTFTLGMLRALEAGEELHVIVKAYQSKREALGYPEKGYKGMTLDATIDILVEVPNMANYKDVAHLTVIGEDDTTTMGSIAAAAVEAMRHGADTLLLTGEGAAKVLQASGWGLMLGGSGTLLMSDGGNGAAGAVIAPGIGYSSAKTAYGFSPFVQAFGLVTR